MRGTIGIPKHPWGLLNPKASPRTIHVDSDVITTLPSTAPHQRQVSDSTTVIGAIEENIQEMSGSTKQEERSSTASRENSAIQGNETVEVCLEGESDSGLTNSKTKHSRSSSEDDPRDEEKDEERERQIPVRLHEDMLADQRMFYEEEIGALEEKYELKIKGLVEQIQALNRKAKRQGQKTRK